MKRIGFAAFGLAAIAYGCTSGNPDKPDGGDGGIPPLDIQGLCEDWPMMVYEAPDAAFATKKPGDLLKCAKDNPIAMADLEKAAKDDGYKGRPFTSGAKLYKIQYRTERGDPAKTPGYSSAAVYLPDTPRAAGLPIVMLARGSRGQAGKCAGSQMDSSQAGINKDFRRLIYPLVGAGYAVIITDLAGYAGYGAAGNPPSVYAGAADVAKSTLDSGRALKNLVPALGDKSIIIGHSQGGHTALSSLAFADSYGTAGKVVGVATFAPLWLSQRAWGAVADPTIGAGYPSDTNVPAAVSVWYHYTHAELLDGPGNGVDVFNPSSRAAIKAFVDTQCWEPSPHPELTSLGAHTTDLYDVNFGGSIGLPAAGVGGCGDALCTKWLARYAEDRPHITSKVPILILYGGNDTTIPPNRVICAVDRLKSDQAAMSFCYAPGEDHGSVVAAKGDYVADWIAGLALGQTPPAACAMNESALTDDGGPVTCASPPPND
jgi:pimeloyl-ACP methyl ester carboxylesterase